MTPQTSLEHFTKQSLTETEYCFKLLVAFETLRAKHVFITNIIP